MKKTTTIEELCKGGETMNYLLADGWNEHFPKMEILEDAKGTDFFAVMNYIAPMPCCEQVTILSHGSSLAEIAGYFRYRVVRDMIWMVQSEPDFEPEELTEDRIQSLTAVQKEKAAEPLRFWRLLGECFEKENWEVEFSEILKEFNETFPHLDFLTYEFHCFQNVEELGHFLQKRYPALTEDSEENLAQVFKAENFDAAAFSAYCEEAFDYYGAE